MKILGISCFYHDAAAAIIEDGKIVAAAQEERFTRKKHDPGFPTNAIRYCLATSGTTIDELDAVAFYDKPLLKFERLLETYYAFAPRGIASFLYSMQVWLREKLFLKRLIRNELKEIEKYDPKKLKLLFPEHHLSHAASAFYPSPFKEAAILTIDGVGEWATASICHGEGRNIKILKEMKFPHSLGLLYSAFTYFLGFKVNSGEYKLMGLSPYGVPDSEQVKDFVARIKTHLADIKDDGSIWLNQDYFNYSTGLRMIHGDKWEKLFGFPVRPAEAEIELHHCNLAMAIQIVSEETVIKMAIEAKRLTNAEYLCMAGGVALNCVANGKLLDMGVFREIFVQPAAGDAGGSLGAAQAAYHIHFEQPRTADDQHDSMQGGYLGPEFSDKEIELMNRKHKAVASYLPTTEELAVKVASLIDGGNVIGWVQGRMEFGPRALGNRSIIGDPRNEEMQKKMNVKIKFRESFRPFAPAVMAEDCPKYFKGVTNSPYMLLVQPINEEYRKVVQDNYWTLPLKERLYAQRSTLPAITHVDMSCRIQTVHRDTNLRFWTLINEFKKLSGHGMVINTSFNVRSEPIVCTPEDSYRCFMRTEMDYLVIGNHLYDKKTQPAWPGKPEDWMKEFEID